MNRINIIKKIKESKKYDIALFTTFNLDISFFERRILKELYDNLVHKVSLFVDSNEFSKSLQNADDRKNASIGKKYIVTPIRMNSSFHPKVALLIGKNKARLIIGSLNLTTNGYYLNNEVVNIYDYSENKEENLALIRSAFDFFVDINNLSDRRDDKLIEQAKKYPYLAKNRINEESDNTFFISNINDSIFLQINKIIKEKVVSIDVAVPYYDLNNSCLEEIKDVYGDATINLYIQNKTSTFPKKDINKYNINVFNGVSLSDNKLAYNFYHGKVFRFNTTDKSYILFGSANCTKSAFLKSKENGGNIEADILCIGNINDYDYYFNNFAICDDVELESELIHYDKNLNNDFSFLNSEENTLFFKYKGNINNLKISILDKDMNFSKNDGIVSVLIPNDLKTELSGIFEVVFDNNGVIEKVCCYFDEKEILEFNRNQLLENKLWKINSNPDLDASYDVYRNERMELIVRMSDMYEILRDKSYEEFNKVANLNNPEVNDIKEDDEDILSGEESIDRDFAFSFENKENNEKNKSRVTTAQKYIFDNFYERLISLRDNSKKGTREIIDTQGIIPSNRQTHREKTGEDKKFVKTVKRVITDMLNKDNSVLLDFSNYIKSVVVIFELFNRIIIRDGNMDLFDNYDVIEAQFKLMDELSKKMDDGFIDEKEKDMFIWLSISCVIQCDMISNRDDIIKRRNKELLNRIDKKLKIRDCIDEYLETVIPFIGMNNEIETKERYKKLVDNLFGYKTFNQLDSFLKKTFGENVVITQDTNFEIIADCDIKPFLKLSKGIENEIKKYCEGTCFTPNKILININNKYVNYDNPNPIIRIEYNLDLVYKSKSYKQETRKLGICMPEKVSYKD